MCVSVAPIPPSAHHNHRTGRGYDSVDLSGRICSSERGAAPDRITTVGAGVGDDVVRAPDSGFRLDVDAVSKAAQYPGVSRWRDDRERPSSTDGDEGLSTTG
jgi:hypothetical protein